MTEHVQAADTTAVHTQGADSLMTLFAQAGGFQWPILAVLVAGLLVLASGSVRLFFDGLTARRLRRMPVDTIDEADLARELKASADSLYARLLSGMLKVWRACPGDASALGQEARTIADAARATYARSERLVAFLSSSAGGLGLLGTLVGIYVLFSSGSRDAETVFAGIAIAVVSTLLGIVVTITLELLETAVQGWLSRYIESAESWAAAIRYRLMTLGREEPGA